MKMRSFIPNIEDPPESDDSDEEIPPGGVLFPVVAIQDAESGDGSGAEEQDISGDNGPDIEDDLSEGDISVNDDSDENVSEADISVNDESDEELLGSDDSVLPEGILFPMGREGGRRSGGYDSSGDNFDADTDSDSDVPDTTLEEVFGIKANIEAHRDHPPDIVCDSSAVDICFHPEIELLSTATMDGEVIIYRYSRESTEEVTRFTHHDKACRTICYSSDGKVLYSVSKDQSFAVIDCENSSLKSHFKEAHDASIYSFVAIDDNICATGDDDGTVKIWDLRKNKEVFSYKCGEQTIHSLLGDKKYLAATLCDGSLSGFNIRAKRLEAQSEMYSSELTSMCLVRDDARLVVGSGEGVMYIFKWGDFGFHIDRYAGHPGQINCMIPVGDRLLLSGCEDGNIRAVHLYPHRFVGVVGQHKRFGIENMSVSFDGSFLASCAMDDVVRFWNIDFLYNVEVDGRMKGHKRHDKGFNLESSKRRNRSDFFSDIPEKMESDDEGGPVAGPSHTTD